MKNKQTHNRVHYSHPLYKYRNTGEGAFPWATCSALPLIYCQSPTVLCQCCAPGFVSFSWDLGMADCWLCGGLRSLDKPSSLPLFLPFLPSLGNCHRGGAPAGGAGLPTPSPLGVLLKGNVGLFFFALLFIWRITSIVLPAVTDTEVAC